MKNCSYCNQPNDDATAFCSSCGKPFGQAAPPPPPQYQAPIPNNGYIGVRREGITVLLLSIVTCGIYMYWWFYQCMEDINKASGERRLNSMGLLLGSIFCPFVIYLMLYNIDRNLARLSQENGTFYKENFVMWLLMTLLCGLGTYISLFQVSSGLNEIWDKRQGVQPLRY